MGKRRELTVEEMLNECCRARGIQTCLIHRTIHTFNWFYGNLIQNNNAIINDDLYPLQHEKLIEMINEWQYPDDHDNTLKSAVQLYYRWCKLNYDEMWIDGKITKESIGFKKGVDLLR